MILSISEKLTWKLATGTDIFSNSFLAFCKMQKKNVEGKNNKINAIKKYNTNYHTDKIIIASLLHYQCW